MVVSELKDRLSDVLLELLSTKYKNKSKLAKALDTNSTSITQYIEAKSTYPQVDFIYNLCVKANINPTWLILGLGKKQIDDKEILNLQKVIGNNNSNITQIMHNNDILANENESLKRENALLREMIELYKNKVN